MCATDNDIKGTSNRSHVSVSGRFNIMHKDQHSHDNNRLLGLTAIWVNRSICCFLCWSVLRASLLSSLTELSWLQISNKAESAPSLPLSSNPTWNRDLEEEKNTYILAPLHSHFHYGSLEVDAMHTKHTQPSSRWGNGYRHGPCLPRNQQSSVAMDTV